MKTRRGGETASPPLEFKPLLKQRDFVLFLITRLANTTGTNMLTVAVGWQIYNLTNNPLDLGIIGLCQFAPMFLFFLAAGIVADRFDRKIIIAVCLAFEALACSFLFYYALSGGSRALPIFLILLVHGASRAFFQPASQAILPTLVAHQQFAGAVAYSTSVNKAAQLAGPLLAGVMIAWSNDWTYFMILILFVIAGFAAAMISTKLLLKSRQPVTLPFILEGFAYIIKKKIVLGAISIDLVAVLFGSIVGMLPIFARDILNVGPEGLGAMRAMPAVGALATGLILAKMGEIRHAGRLFFITLTVFSVSITVFGFSELYWLSLVCLVVYGAADMISVYIRTTLVQLATPDSIRGRVSSVNSVSINASNELGDFRAGIMSAAIGVVPAVVFGGGMTLAIAALWWKLFPELKNVDRMTQNL